MRSTCHSIVAQPVATEHGTQIRRAKQGTALIAHRLRLRVLEGADQGRETTLEGTHALIGSAPDSDLVLSDPEVSRRHCSISTEGDKYILRDLESTNGTFVTGVRVREAELTPGMTLSVGSTVIAFEPKQRFVRLQSSDSASFGELLGVSAAMRAVFGTLERVAGTSLACVLLGETGTGKELAARALHEQSARNAGPFVVLDCAQSAGNLFESELFGHERGAFTGADRSRPGAFELARGGTLFLDEVGELPLELQPKLLRVLERRETKRLGASEGYPVDCRVVAATHRPLEDMVGTGTFRRDLYFRLAEVVVELPPLRDRMEDVVPIAEALLSRHEEGRSFSEEALDALKQHDFPGNVRELRNIVRRAAELSASATIAAADLGLVRQERPRQEAAASAGVDASVPLKEARAAWNECFETEYVRALLERHAWDFDDAAAAAGIHIKSLQRLARERGIK